jgi:hypothetical protein
MLFPHAPLSQRAAPLVRAALASMIGCTAIRGATYLGWGILFLCSLDRRFPDWFLLSFLALPVLQALWGVALLFFALSLSGHVARVPAFVAAAAAMPSLAALLVQFNLVPGFNLADHLD